MKRISTAPRLGIAVAALAAALVIMQPLVAEARGGGGGSHGGGGGGGFHGGGFHGGGFHGGGFHGGGVNRGCGGRGGRGVALPGPRPPVDGGQMVERHRRVKVVRGVRRDVPHEEGDREGGGGGARVAEPVLVLAAAGVLGDEQRAQKRLREHDRNKPIDQHAIIAEADCRRRGQIDRQLRRHRQRNCMPRRRRHKRQVAC